VRDAESIARRIAFDRVRKKEYLYSPEIIEMERELGEALGTRVAIETKENGGKLSIDFTNEDDLRVIFNQLAAKIASPKVSSLPVGSQQGTPGTPFSDENGQVLGQSPAEPLPPSIATPSEELSSTEVSQEVSAESLDDRTKEEKERDENTFDPSSFSL
jgi:hypothetical protein